MLLERECSHCWRSLMTYRKLNAEFCIHYLSGLVQCAKTEDKLRFSIF
jgi:hypothetical protein